MKEQRFAQKMAETLMTQFPCADQYPYRSWTYPQGFMLWGFMRLWERTGDKRYLRYILEYTESHVAADGTLDLFNGSSMDDIMTGSVLVWAWRQTGDNRYLTACRRIRSVFDNYPHTTDGCFWHGRNLTGEF